MALAFLRWEKSLTGKPFWGVLAESLRIKIKIFFEDFNYRSSTTPAHPWGAIIDWRISLGIFFLELLKISALRSKRVLSDGV